MTIKSAAEIERMKAAGRLTAQTLDMLARLIREGITTQALNDAADAFIRSHGATPSFLGYDSYPKSICVSVNSEVVHGIPGKRRIKDGDIVSVDVGAYLGGCHGDAARTFLVGNVTDEVKRLVEVTRECFYKGIAFAKKGYRVSDISLSIQRHAEANGYGVVRELTGHGIGKNMHELPNVPNFHVPSAGKGVRLAPGMTLAIEPMINLGGKEVFVRDDKWTVETRDFKPSAHYENTVLITEGEPLILTVTTEVS